MTISIPPVSRDQFVGPAQPPKAPRGQYSHCWNETASLQDRVFRNASKPVWESSDSRHLGAPIDPRKVIIIHGVILPPLTELVGPYREMIADHVHQRVSFFFQQLIACYCTKLHFEQNEALDQAETADSLKAMAEQGEVKVCTRNAAHSATLPCLIAYDDAAWKAYAQAQRTLPCPNGFVFLKGSDYYRLSNTTMEVPDFVNKADIKIDGSARNSLLRSQCIELLNRASQGEVTPEEGLKTFMNLAIAQVKSSNRPDTSPAIARTLDCYHDDLSKIKTVVETDPTIFDRMLDVRVDVADAAAAARKTIYQIRHRAIRDVHFAQAQLIDQVQKIKKEVLRLIARGRRIQPEDFRKPDYFEEAFRVVFIDQAQTPEDRVRLLKLFNAPSGVPGFRPLEECQVTRFNKTSALIQPHIDKIKFVAQTVCMDMRHLRTQEADLRGSVTRELRGLRSWRQVDLSREIQKLFPSIPSSQSTISRIENPNGLNGKLVNPALAAQLAGVFRVDPGLFMPHFFYE